MSAFDLAGRLVKIIANAELQAGMHELSWNAKDEKGSAAGSGIYFPKCRQQIIMKQKK